jgi:hypothetical protein
MSRESAKVYGLSPEEWQAGFRPGIQEFAAFRYLISRENGLIRIAFGNNGPFLDEQGARGCAVYSHAVSMTPVLALELSKSLRDLIADTSTEKK